MSGSGNGTKRIPKNIILFSDGTGNSASNFTKTNVWRIYEALDKDAESKVVQVALYDNGVGSSSFILSRYLGSAFGVGLKSNVKELYAFLCKNYLPGDNVYLFGFSRGAFTVRLVAGIIGKQGILTANGTPGAISHGELAPLVDGAYRSLENEFPNKGSPIVWLYRHLRRAFYATCNAATRCKTIEDAPRTPPVAKGDIFSSATADKNAWIKFMGIFDTVSAYGGPVEEFTTAWSWLLAPIEPKDWSVGGHVVKVCQALALDETRQPFHPKLINESVKDGWAKKLEKPAAHHNPTPEIEQVWFAGAHANVGGGYGNDGLSAFPLRWMLHHAVDAGLKFPKRKLRKYDRDFDHTAPLHDPRAGAGGSYRYGPRNLLELTEAYDQVYIETPKIHGSVFQRIKNVPGYSPIALNKPFKVIEESECLCPPKNPKVADERRSALQKREQEWLLFEASHAESFLDPEMLGWHCCQPLRYQKNNQVHAIEKAWDQVWLKRSVNKAMTLMITLSFLIWIAGAGEWALLPLGVCGALFVGSRPMAANINASLIGYWDEIIGAGTAPAAVKITPQSEKTLSSKLRAIQISQKFFKLWRGVLLPMIFGVGIVLTFGGIANHTVFKVRELMFYGAMNWGLSCPLGEQLDEAGKRRFQTAQACNDTGIKLLKNETYRIEIQMEDGPYSDLYLPATLKGLTENGDYRVAHVFMKLLAPLRRHPTEPWFRPILKIEGGYLEKTALVNDAGWKTTDDGKTLITDFKAFADGRAYLHINDVPFAFWPNANLLFYNNNKGSGWVKITPKS